MSHSSNQQGKKVAVFGAAGHTGRFVVRELLRRGLTPVAIARDAERLAASGLDRSVEMRTASVDDPASLQLALAGTAAVINCAGPFLDTAEPVLQAALQARIHYVDVTAEQGSAMTLFEHYGDRAREVGIVAIPAMGFYGGLGDLLVKAATAGWDEVDDVRIAIALDSWQPTLGTRVTGKRNTARRMTVADGVFTPLPDPAPAAQWEFPQPFGVQDVVELPFSETITIPRHVRVANLHSFLNLTPLRELRDAATPPPLAVDDSGRSAQVFLVDVTVRRAGEERRMTARGQDIYAFTAPLVVEAVQRMLDGKVEGRGVLAAGEAFDAADFLAALAPAGLSLDRAA